MSKELIVEEILQDGRKEVGRLVTGEIVIGRDPEPGIKLENTAVSREHGVFVRIRNHWFYRDLGSTNGSWKNGKIIKGGQMVLVRPGDVMQLADVPLRVMSGDQDPYSSSGLAGFPSFSSSTLIVFSGDDFHDEFPLPEYGRALVVGGNQADLKIGNDMNELPRLVVERRGERVVAYGVAEAPGILINGDELGETETLRDGDEIEVEQYKILFNDPKSDPHAAGQAVPAMTPGQAMAGAAPGMGAAPAGGALTGGVRTGAIFREWESGTDEAPGRSSGGRFTFGQGDVPEGEDLEGTMAIDPAEVEARLSGYDLHPTSRYSGSQQGGAPLNSLEDKLIVLVGFVLLLVLIGLVAWWVFK